MSRPPLPPQREISDATLSGFSLGEPRPRPQGRSRMRAIGINVLGLLLAATGIMGFVQADVTRQAVAAEVAEARDIYAAAVDRKEGAEDDLARLPRPVEATRWVSAAGDAAARVSEKQSLLLDSTSPIASGGWETQRTPRPSNAPPLTQAELDEEERLDRRDRVARTERELIMLFAPAARDDDGLNGGGHWHEDVPGMPTDASGYEWVASARPMLTRQMMVSVAWVLVAPDGTSKAVVTGSYHPQSRIFDQLRLMVLDADQEG